MVSSGNSVLVPGVRLAARSTVSRNSAVAAHSSGGRNNDVRNSGAAEHSVWEHIAGAVGRSSTGRIVQWYRASRQQLRLAEANSALATPRRN
jgi:hypothetical protein